MSETTVLDRIKLLTSDQRAAARASAERAVIATYGKAPTPAAFTRAGIASKPGWYAWLVAALCSLVLLAAFMLSAMHLHHAGKVAFAHGLADANSAAAAGIGIVVLAEATQLIATLALAQVQRKMRLALYATAALATCIAIVGNIWIAQPHDFDALSWEGAFAWLIATAPPLIVLSMSHVLLHQALEAIEARHASRIAYADALAKWTMQTESDPTLHPRWLQLYALALKDALRSANVRRIDVAEWNAISAREWVQLVQREMQEDAAFDAIAMQPQLHVQPPPPQIVERPRSGGGGGNSSNVVNLAVNAATFDGEQWMAKCPDCGQPVYNVNQKNLKRGLSAHMRGCKRNAP